MGIYDREYYRREGPSFLDAIANRGRVCKYLIGINVVVFILQIMVQPVTGWLILDVDAVLHGEVWRLLTYAFLHSPASIMHILFNMLFLWWFGSDVEDIYGPREFLVFYLVSALLGGAAFVAWALNFGILPGQPLPRCLGASGAVTAVLVLCAMHYPSRIILIWFLPVPIWLFVLFQVAQDLFGLMGGGGHTAFVVHLAGAGFAFLYCKSQIRLSNFWPSLRGTIRSRSRPQLRVFRETEEEEPAPVTAPPVGEGDEHLEAKLDAVLEKVARLGQGSLTESERAILLRASEIYKKRRS